MNDNLPERDSDFGPVYEPEDEFFCDRCGLPASKKEIDTHDGVCAVCFHELMNGGEIE